jgi:hypothetical protein
VRATGEELVQTAGEDEISQWEEDQMDRPGQHQWQKE